MTHVERVLFVVPNLRNPMAQVWLRGLNEAGLTVTPFVLNDADNPSVSDLSDAVDLVLYWWGIGAYVKLPLAIRQIAKRTPTLLCIDTYPNAAFSVTARRERRWAAAACPRPSGLISYSDAMTRAIRAEIPEWSNLPTLGLPMPLLDQMLCGCEGCVGEGADEIPPSGALLFQGRSDHLFSRDPRMAKDALGRQFRRIRREQIFVTLPQAFGASEFDTYASFSEEEMLDGTFATFGSRFAGHLAIYNEFNSTIRRRVSNGLSTRFAFALTSCSPILVSDRSEFALNGPYKAFTLNTGHRLNRLPHVLADSDRLLQARRSHRVFIEGNKWSIVWPSFRRFLDEVASSGVG